jgi:hypothetical protein
MVLYAISWYNLTNYMEHSPSWEANSHSANPSPSTIHSTNGGLSVNPSWRRASCGTHDQMSIFCQTITGLVLSRHAISPLITGRVCLLLVVMSLSGVTIQKIKLFIICTICNIYTIYDMYKASQEIPHALQNLKFHYRTHKSPSLVRILKQMNPVYTFPFYFPKIHCNIVLSSTPRDITSYHNT